MWIREPIGEADRCGGLSQRVDRVFEAERHCQRDAAEGVSQHSHKLYPLTAQA